MDATGDIRLGAERLLDGEVDVPGWRSAPTAIVTHAAAVTADLRPTLEGLLTAGCVPRAVVTPEHGFTGGGQPGSAEVPGVDLGLGAQTRVVDGYDRGGERLAAELDGIELVLVDLSDLGVRCSTYLTLLDDVLAAATLTGARVVVLDRPNPLGATVAGPTLDPRLRSHVGRLIAPLRHGLTIGQAARRMAGGDVSLDVVAVTGTRGTRPWVAPSPNLPTAEATLCYSGTVLLEGVGGAEPRGTASPFQLIGADWIDSGVVRQVAGLDPPGLALRAATMTPAWGPLRGEPLPAIFMHVTDASTADPLRAVIELLVAAIAAGHELVFTDHFDLIAGDPALADQLRAGDDADTIIAHWS